MSWSVKAHISYQSVQWRLTAVVGIVPQCPVCTSYEHCTLTVAYHTVSRVDWIKPAGTMFLSQFLTWHGKPKDYMLPSCWGIALSALVTMPWKSD